MDTDLSGCTAVVTGGNGGIGLGIARALATNGADVAIWARNEEKSAAAVASLQSTGRDVAAFVCDVRNEEAVNAAMATTVERFGKVDVLVANSGVSSSARIDALTTSEWDRVVGTNLSGVFFCFRVASRHLLERASPGALVAVSSVAAIHAAPFMAHYAAAKAGILALVRSVANELAPHGIRVNALTPGWTETENRTMDTVDSELSLASRASIPAGRWATTDELAAGALFLANPKFAFHTGTNLLVDGGYSTMPPYDAVRKALRLREPPE